MSKRKTVIKTFVEECWSSQYDENYILELFTENCLTKTSFTSIGNENFLRDWHDWRVAFPDFTAECQSIEEYQDVIICDVVCRGTHLHMYQSTNREKKGILATSEFFTNVEHAVPTGSRYEIPARTVITFDRSKISHFILEEDLFDLARQLGLRVCRAGKGTEAPVSLEAINEALGAALSMREVECLALAICGFSAKHVATVLGISYRTVETHLNHAYQKLGCSGKQQLLEFFHENRLLALWLEVGKKVLEHYAEEGWLSKGIMGPMAEL